MDKTSATTFMLLNLDPSQSYGVTVRARNAHCISEPSGIAEVGGFAKIVAQVPSAIAEKLQEAQVILQEASTTASSSAKIMWQVSTSV